ncbi:GDSL family lipase [Pedobacter petrophilus]|uniref:GDSL family lipase n=1 Tax=Pedobacter petrophilus TaxID=1908241 RepID=A0A7K0FSV7_9SPHI|nr:GDSL-type esterase/lipase family protein [Pedobacter petrophilus]MRX74697.1 GDSL family lipase [Pedobacter petrophilus]
MINRIKLTVIFILGFIKVVSAQKPADSAFLTPHYKKQIESFRKIPVSENQVIFIGNSITEVGEWKKLIPDKNILNLGISGDVTLGVINRLHEEILSKPKAIFVMIGINDLKIGVPISEITARQKAIINIITTESPKTKIFMQSTLPVNEKMLAEIYKRLNNHDISKMNSALQKLCKKLQVSYIDLWPVMINKEGQLQQKLSTDGLHLKPNAYLKWVKYLNDQNYL